MRILRIIDRISRRFLAGLIWVYQRLLSPYLPPSCRFVPTCSNYALEALQRKSLPVALWFIVRRLLRCHPLSRGGIDPLP
ncbi:membrane protein insertion efficiency factor YidD [Candidatus Sumerlaeota bacterium]|nr:membrane protein insertion efficiency factor YidD [Candidatus Sumerlaeota bacterium]